MKWLAIFGCENTKVIELTEKFKPTGHKRILEIMRTFFEGIE